MPEGKVSVKVPNNEVLLLSAFQSETERAGVLRAVVDMWVSAKPQEHGIVFELATNRGNYASIFTGTAIAGRGKEGM